MRVILIGVGGFGRSWWPALREHSDVQVVGLVDTDPTELDVAAQTLGVSSKCCFSGGDEWAGLPADAIIDSSPASFHHHHIMVALGAGLHVLTVKPMVDDPHDALEIIAEAEARKRALVVAYQKRFLPGFLKVRELVQSGQLGRPAIADWDLRVDGTFWKPGLAWREKMVHPLLLDGAIHHFDLMRWCLDEEPLALNADSWNPPWSPFKGDASLAAWIRMTNDVHVNYRGTFAPRGGPIMTFFSGLRIECTGGVIEVDEGEVVVDGKALGVRPLGGNPDLSDLNREVFTRFLNEARDGKPSGLSGSGQVNSMAMMFACVEAIHRRSWVDVKHIWDV